MKKVLHNRVFQYFLVVIAGVLVGVMIFSSYKLIRDKVEHSQARAKDDTASSSYALTESVPPAPRVYSEQVQQEIQLDDEISPLNSMYNLNLFYADYPDAIGWIYGPNTPIDYGIVEAKDNDYYLHRFYDGSYSAGGSLFADCNGARDFSDQNTIIYGHHMNDGTKFASIMGYREVGYYEKHPVLYISTPSMNYRVEVFSAYLTDADSDTYTFRFDNSSSYAAWLQRMLKQSDFKTDVKLTTNDRVVTLSTCSYEYTDARYVVLGKLVPIH